MKKTLISLCLLFLMAGVAHAQAAFSGNWTGVFRATTGSESMAALNLNVNGSGTSAIVAGDLTIGQSVTTAIENGKVVDATTIIFAAVLSAPARGGAPAVQGQRLYYTLKLDGTTIHVSRSPQDPSVPAPVLRNNSGAVSTGRTTMTFDLKKS